MLIEFNVKNYRSFQQKHTLRTTASSDTNLLHKNSYDPKARGVPRLLRSTVIYGPNAAGKSNLITALHFMKNFVLSSSQKGQEGDSISVKPFLFQSKELKKPSEFEVIFMQDNVRYQYGFAVDTTRVVAEWLIAYPQVRAQRWFDRLYDSDTGKDTWRFGPKFIGKKRVWQEATRSNALFLSSAIQLNNEQLKPVFQWFKNLVIIRQQSIPDPIFSMHKCEEKKDCEKVIEFMSKADISIDNIRIEKREIPFEELPDDIPSELKRRILKEAGDNKEARFMSIRAVFGHKVDNNKELAWLPFSEESDGTMKLFAYAGPLLDGLHKGRVFFVDELDNSFHSHMVRFIIDLFHSENTNKLNSQLIFTTHDTSILDQKLMRRDQVWFVEKDEHNASNLYSLSDFKPKPRKSEALERGYLMGRYGAIPFMGKFNF